MAQSTGLDRSDRQSFGGVAGGSRKIVIDTGQEASPQQNRGGRRRLRLPLFLSYLWAPIQVIGIMTGTVMVFVAISIASANLATGLIVSCIAWLALSWSFRYVEQSLDIATWRIEGLWRELSARYGPIILFPGLDGEVCLFPDGQRNHVVRARSILEALTEAQSYWR